MRASPPGDCAAQSKARCLVAEMKSTPVEVFLHCKEKGPKTRLYGAVLPAHNKTDGFMLTSFCGQTAPAIARLKFWPAAPWPR